MNSKYYIKKAKNKLELDLLKNEIIVLEKLKTCPFVSKIIEYKFDDNKGYIKYLLFDGKPLYQKNFNNFEETIRIMIEITEKVKIIHQNGIIHCDLTMSNILINDCNQVYIVDFGISKINYKDYLFPCLGTIEYCAPEQYNNKVLIDYRTDIYSLGIIFYKSVFNNFPFNGTNEEIKKKKLTEFICITNNTIVNKIINKTINYNINKRYQDIDELINDLKKLLEN